MACSILNGSLELCKGWEGVWCKLCILKMRNLKLRECNQLLKVQRSARWDENPIYSLHPKSLLVILPKLRATLFSPRGTPVMVFRHQEHFLCSLALGYRFLDGNGRAACSVLRDMWSGLCSCLSSSSQVRKSCAFCDEANNHLTTLRRRLSLTDTLASL